MIRLIQQTGFNFHHTPLEVKNKTLFYLMWNGPSEPRDEPAPQIVSLEFLENIPDKFKERLSSRYRKAFIHFYILFWFKLCYNILVPYFTVPPHISTDPNMHIHTLSCASLPEFWKGKNGACGLNGSYAQRL